MAGPSLRRECEGAARSGPPASARRNTYWWHLGTRRGCRQSRARSRIGGTNLTTAESPRTSRRSMSFEGGKTANGFWYKERAYFFQPYADDSDHMWMCSIVREGILNGVTRYRAGNRWQYLEFNLGPGSMGIVSTHLEPTGDVGR